MKKKFVKKVEDFICEVCSQKIRGSGYTDHCPRCLFSKHVDISPGDRKAQCGGLMEPVGITKRKEKWQILYRCQKCDYQRFNKIAPEDNQKRIAELSNQLLNQTDSRWRISL